MNSQRSRHGTSCAEPGLVSKDRCGSAGTHPQLVGLRTRPALRASGYIERLRSAGQSSRIPKPRRRCRETRNALSWKQRRPGTPKGAALRACNTSTGRPLREGPAGRAPDRPAAAPQAAPTAKRPPRAAATKKPPAPRQAAPAVVPEQRNGRSGNRRRYEQAKNHARGRPPRSGKEDRRRLRSPSHNSSRNAWADRLL
jgi:hypothetical protein